jgi:hypothetical protein
VKGSSKYSDLSLIHNWRRQLLLTHESSHDLDNPIEYVAIDAKYLPMKISKFCQEKWYSFGFDYDLSTQVLWPLEDSVSAQELADKINKKFTKAASVIKKPPIEAHNLDNDSLRLDIENSEASY